MKELRPRLVLSVVPILLISAALTGMLSGQSQTPSRNPSNADSMKQFDNLLVLVEENYATRVDPERAVYGAIDGMLRTLDPHSKFFDPKAFKQLREDQTGKYAGLGISVTMRFNKITVASPPFANSPAERAGLRVGDVISHVEGKPTEGLVTDEVVTLLRGRPSTAVNITILRPGAPAPLDFRIVRQVIERHTINHAYVIRPGIGYIKIDSFAETTGTDLKDALKALDSRRLDGLILDLRNNPGGLLTEAINVSAMFLKRGQSILKTGGRTEGSTREFNSEQRDPEPPYPLVVLLNQNSASASEIVAGAIQDHDRGLIVGETSFGKGLVQSVYTLRNNSGGETGLALTTQKWFTPSGRLIQRDYSQISNFDYMYHRDGPAEQQRERAFSDSGRIVYGGGGITPDHIVPVQKLTEFQTSLMFEKFAFFSFMQQVVAKTPTIDKSWQVTDTVLADFKQHLRDRRIDFTEQQFEENKDFIKLRILYEVYYSRLSVAEAQKVLNEGDPQVLKAIELLPEAKKLQLQGPVVTADR